MNRAEQPLRILIVTEDIPVPHVGGAGRHAVSLGNALLDAGHQVEMLGRRSESEHAANGFRGTLHRGIDFRGSGWQEHRFGAFLPYRRHHMARRVWRAICAVGADRFDVIHYHGHVSELAAVVPAGVNLVHTQHDQGADCIRFTRYREGQICRRSDPADCAGCASARPNTLQRQLSAWAVRVHRQAAREGFARHQAVHVSQFLADRFKAHVDPALRSDVVHNFTELAPQDSAPVSDERPVLFMAGRVEATKGFMALLDAMPDALLARYRVRLAGDGPDMVELRRRHGGRDLALLGSLLPAAVYAETAAAAACVVPSICEEACPTTVLEALALGKPVFALRRGGTPELARYQGYAGQLQLADTLVELVQGLQSGLPACGSGAREVGVTARLPALVAIYRRRL